jgi:Transglycosylase SLT domain
VKTSRLASPRSFWSQIFPKALRLMILVSLCETGAHAEDAGEATRTSSNFGKSDSSLGPHYKVCRTVEKAAADNNLPIEFFTRVIWQESKFDVRARSSAGAQGIAQFMPRTAASRGLNPFDPIESLRESASYLRELRNKFGNLGLAAAAYNAGPGRVAKWLSRNLHLPGETIAYVRLVTGRPISEWMSPQSSSSQVTEIPKGVPCAGLANGSPNEPASSPSNESGARPTAPWAAWGVQLAGDWTRDQVLSKYDYLRRKYFPVLGDKDPLVLITYGPSGLTKRYLARVAENTQQEAEQLCKRLQSLGGSCFAIRNHPE